MNQSTKTCVMCRKDIDIDAKICPYCNSSIDYSALISISSTELLKHSSTLKEVLLVAIMLILVGAGFGLGFLLGGFWIAVFGSIIAYKISTFIYEASPASTYTYHLTCPLCFTAEDVVWASKTFDENSRGFRICCNCGKKITVEST